MRLQKERTRLGVEALEDRLAPSWGSIPPSTITLPSSFGAVTLNSSGDATGSAAITSNEIDWYKFTATAGSFTISTATPSSHLDTVIGLYNSAGQRVAYNNNISWYNTDSRFTKTLAAGTYYLGVTNYTGKVGGSYNWAIDGPALSPPPPPPSGGFDITLRMTGLTDSQQAIFQRAADRWEQVITGDLPDVTYNGILVDDVLIDASSVYIDGNYGILGQAGPDRLRSGSYLPYHGIMEFDSADVARLEASGGLYYVALHEMGHVLGIGTIWGYLGLITGKGTSDPLFIGPQATAAYNQIFGTSASGVPVENTGGSGTRDAHWRESVFGNELMTGYLNSGTNPISLVTVASLADMGYQVDMNAADPYTP